MIRIKRNNSISGRFFAKKQLLQFPCMEDMITDQDILDLFKGLIELVKKSTEMKIERKYSILIDVLKSELQRYQEDN